MKIKETIERECCMQHDLKSYLGKFSRAEFDEKTFKFCVYCGQIWECTRRMDDAGSKSDVYERVLI